MNPLKKLAFLWSYSLLAVILGSYYIGGPGYTWLGGFYVYAIIPVLDAIAGKDRQNVGDVDYDDVLNDHYFDVLVYSFVYIQYALLIWGCYVLTFNEFTTGQSIRLMISIGLFGGTIINIAHELGHRSGKTAQVHAKAALLSVSYMHFFIEHNRGHHVHVATLNDPATSRRGQSVYAFWWQSIVGSYHSAWRIEEKLLAKAGHKTWSRYNNMIWFTALPVVLLLALTVGFGLWAGGFVWQIPVFFGVQSLIAILLLESVNYIEHYGILRREVSPGRFERVNPLHSWNASHFVSNLVLFQLQRHSDHHANASRPYQVLRHVDESPQLPFGYPLMILISLVPPLWFRLMDNRLDTWSRQRNQFQPA